MFKENKIPSAQVQLGDPIAFVPIPLFPLQFEQLVDDIEQLMHLFAHFKQFYPDR